MTHLDYMGLKLNSTNGRLDEASYPTREWRVGWLLTERVKIPMLSKISQMMVGGTYMLFRPSKDFCEEFGLHHGTGACHKFIQERRMRVDLPVMPMWQQRDWHGIAYGKQALQAQGAGGL